MALVWTQGEISVCKTIKQIKLICFLLSSRDLRYNVKNMNNSRIKHKSRIQVCIEMTQLMGKMFVRKTWNLFLFRQATAAANNISATPTFLFFRNRVRVDQYQGADAAGLEEKIKQHTENDPGNSEDSDIPKGYVSIRHHAISHHDVSQTAGYNYCGESSDWSLSTHPSIHSLYFTYPIQDRGGLKPIPATIGREAGYTLAVSQYLVSWLHSQLPK